MPMIEYTLEFLANAGVREVFVYCGEEHADEMEDYVRFENPLAFLALARSEL